MSRGRDVYSVVRPVLVTLATILRCLPRAVRYGVLAAFRGTPGLLGVGLRYVAVKSIARACGDNVYVGPYCFLSHLENATLGNNISIREMCVVGCCGGLSIGDNTSIAHCSSILTTDHEVQVGWTSIRDAPVIPKRTIISDNVWIGAGVRVTAGVSIGRGSVLGAGSVVTRDVPPGSVAAGVPARILWRRE
jgi:acetyltransferase-like isoleucine patch superfamily enzyme